MHFLAIGIFVVVILAFLALDLGVFHRGPRKISTRAALGWTGVWVSVSLLFNVAVYFLYEHHWLDLGLGDKPLEGWKAAVLYFTGYAVELSLSLDNIFVIAMIFSYFNVPAQYQHRVLFWGIVGALVMRGIMIVLGTALIERFEWIVYLFGALLIYTAWRMLRLQDEKIEPERNPLVRLARRCYPVTSDFVGERFFSRLDGRLAITPLFLVLLLIESTDLLFAIDSIPAVMAITTETFIVFTSNIFAILGLRSLYFALAGLMDMFRYLKVSLAFVLFFVGLKMCLSHLLHDVPGLSDVLPLISLGVIVSALATGIIASITIAKREPLGESQPATDP
jgi:tellurite resistance protein TerC